MKAFPRSAKPLFVGSIPDRGDVSAVGGMVCCRGRNALAVFPIDEESIAQTRKQHPLASAEVNDPVYKRKQRYEGLWLRDVLKDLGQGGHPETDVYVRFRCKDGYLPIMPLARAMSGQGLIAIRDANAPQGADWQPLPGSGAALPGEAE